MAKVVTTFVSDDKDMMASIERMNRKIDELEQKNRELANSSQKATKNTADSWQVAISAGATALSGYVSLTQALQLYNRELEHKLELERKARDLQISAAAEQRQFLSNLGFASADEQAVAIQRVEGLAKKHGVTPSAVYRPGGQALSGSAGNFENAMQALDYALAIGRDNSSEVGALAMGFQSIARASDSGKIEDALAVMAALGTVTKVETTEFIARNLSPGFAAVQKFGATDEETIATLGVFNQGQDDNTGSVTTSGSISFAKQLAEFLPEKDRYRYVNNRKILERRGTGLTSLGERLAYMHANQALVPEFMSTAFFEKTAYTAAADLLTAGSPTAAQFVQFEQKAREDMETARTTMLADTLNQPQLQQTAKTHQTFTGLHEAYALKQADAARNADLRENFEKTLHVLGYGAWGSSVRMTAFDLNSLVGSSNRDQFMDFAGSHLAGLEMTPAEERTQKQSEQIELLRGIVAELQGMRSEQRLGGGLNANPESK